MHKSPYTGEAAATLEKLTENRQSYNINIIYQYKDTATLYYINSCGYLHILRPSREKCGEFTRYCISDFLLKTDNTLEEVRTHYSSKSKTEAADAFRGMIGELVTA